jgi:hypothetical protein
MPLLLPKSRRTRSGKYAYQDNLAEAELDGQRLDSQPITETDNPQKAQKRDRDRQLGVQKPWTGLSG